MRRRTQEDFLSESRELWGDRWDYSESIFITMKTHVLIKCKEHGETFKQTPEGHLTGKVGCLACNGMRMDLPQFLIRAEKVWGDRWDYSDTSYLNFDSPVSIICKEHGAFHQSPANHLSGRVGCPKCHGLRHTPQSYLEECLKVWGNRWDYSNTHYTKSTEPVTISCREHGSFSQRAASHLQGMVGCPSCSGVKLSQDDFKRRATDTWGDRWDISHVKYLDIKSHVSVVCPDHGEFSQPAETFLLGRMGCPSCRPTGTSKGEKEMVDFIRSLGVETKTNVRGMLSDKSLELDVVVPDKSMAFEFNGVYYHSEKFKDSKYHQRKKSLAAGAGLDLVYIWEDDWRDRKEIVQEHIRQLLGCSTLPKVNGRDTEVRLLFSHEARDFLNTHHIQGFAAASVYLSLVGEDSKVVAVAAFKKRGEDYELVRYATSAQVRGGHSKLVAFFERNYTYRNLITFADLSFGRGNLYLSTGWEFGGEVPPDYRYLVRQSRVHKFNYRKQRFKDDPSLKWEEGLTERELALLNGLLRVYDAGKLRFVRPSHS